MVKRHKGKLKRAPPASHLATSPLAEVEPKGPQVLIMGNRCPPAAKRPAATSDPSKGEPRLRLQ